MSNIPPYQLTGNLRFYDMIRVVAMAFFLFLQPYGRMIAQVTPDREKHDFGTIDRTSDRVADFTFINDDSEDAVVLTTRVPRAYTYLWSAKTIKAGESITLRVKYNPLEKGTVSDELEVYFSSMQDPVILRFRAEVEYIDRNDNPACPSFREIPGENATEKPFTVKVVDRETREVLSGARVRIVQQGRLQRDVNTNRKGLYSEVVPIGYYLVLADADGYISADSSGYINRRNDFLLFELEKDPEAQEEEAVADELPEPEPEAQQDEIAIATGGVPEPEIAEPQPEPVAVTSAELPEDRYARNSVVFLLDVSQSMRQKGKLELLQASMLRMINALRSIDQVALISYASETVVVLNMTAADRKEELERAVAALEAGGMTAGARGFQGAYDMALEHFVEQANNQVIVTTDGAFTKRDQPRILRMAEKYRKKEVKTTVVGIRSKPYAIEILAEIAEAGDGSLVRIEDFDLGQEALLEEIRKQSYIQP